MRMNSSKYEMDCLFEPEDFSIHTIDFNLYQVEPSNNRPICLKVHFHKKSNDFYAVG